MPALHKNIALDTNLVPYLPYSTHLQMTLSRILFILLAVPLITYGRQKDITSIKDTTGRVSVKDYDRLISRYRYDKPDSATWFANKGMALAKETKDTIGIAMMLNQIGMIEDNQGQFQQSRPKYLKARDLYAKVHNLKGVAAVTIRLGVVELRKGNYDKAIGYFLEALKVSEQIHDAKGIMEAYITLGEGYMGQRKYKIAIMYLTKAEAINNTIPFSNLTLNLYNDFGVSYRDIQQYDTAISYFNKGIALSDKPQYQGLNITITNNLASVYAKLGQRDRSIELQKTALAKAIAIKNYLRTFQTLTGLAATYGKSNPKEALNYYQRALDLVKPKGAQKQVIEILQQMATLYASQHQYEKAFETKDKEYTLADSFFYKDMSKQIASLQAAYELHQSQAKLNELKYINAQQRLERRILFSIITATILLLMVVGFYYFRSREFNLKLNKINAELKESNIVKDKLFSVLGHDLRSPFASVIDMLELINDEDISAEDKNEMISKLAKTSKASLEILNNLLRWGQMQIKGVRLNTTDLQPRYIIERNIAMLADAADKKSISVKDEVGDDIYISADPDHFEFVVRNLLSNAIKFTPNGGIVTIGAHSDGSAGRIKFSVQDTGVGIPEEKLESIFKINNISTDGTNDEKGTSLGLVICREFIEANDGTILAKSQPGKGSEFIFTLKRARHLQNGESK